MSRYNVWGDEKVKRRRKVGESVNVKKNKYNKKLPFLFLFLKKKEKI